VSAGACRQARPGRWQGVGHAQRCSGGLRRNARGAAPSARRSLKARHPAVRGPPPGPPPPPPVIGLATCVPAASQLLSEMPSWVNEMEAMFK
jgi:hypothetical protein